MIPDLDTTDPLLYMQLAIHDWLAARTYFAGIPILTAEQGNSLEAVNVAVAKLGLCIIVEPGVPTFGYAGAAINMDYPVRIIVWEKVITNQGPLGTKKRASAVCIEVVKALRPQTPPAPCVCTEAELTRDSGGDCVYTLVAKKKFTL
jgi:hypothetical protein